MLHRQWAERASTTEKEPGRARGTDWCSRGWHVAWRSLLYVSGCPDSCSSEPQLLYFLFVNLIVRLQLPTWMRAGSVPVPDKSVTNGLLYPVLSRGLSATFVLLSISNEASPTDGQMWTDGQM